MKDQRWRCFGTDGYPRLEFEAVPALAIIQHAGRVGKDREVRPRRLPVSRVLERRGALFRVAHIGREIGTHRKANDAGLMRIGPIGRGLLSQ